MANFRRRFGRMLVSVLAALVPFAAAADPVAGARPWSLEGQTPFLRMPSIQTAAVTAMAQDRQGLLWLGTQSDLLRWDGYRLHTYARNPEAAGALPDNFIRSLLVDDRGQLWVGTNSGGLSRYDPQTDGFVSLPIGPGGTRDGTITALASDGRNGLWIGTGHGIEHLDGASGRIEPLDDKSPQAAIPALLLDHEGALWVGTRKGLLRRSSADLEFQPFPLPAPDGPAPVVRTLHEDGAGRVWIGTDQAGAFVVEPGSDKARRLLESPVSGRPLNEDISAICDVDKDEVWLGTTESGIVRVNTATWKIRREQRQPMRSESLPSDQIDSLFLDRSGIMWIGTRAALSKVDARQRLIQTFYGGATGSLIDGETTSALLPIPDGRVWMAVIGGGIQIVDPVSGRVARIHAKPEDADHALPRSEVIAMARWQDGRVFLGTATGLFRASADGHVVERVQVPNRSRTLDVRALLASDGHLWLGGLEGLLELEVLPGGALHLQRKWDKELGDPRVRTLVRSEDAGVWIGTPSGVAHLDAAAGEVTRLASDLRNPGALPGGYVSALLTDRKGRLWVATFGRGVEVEQGRDAQGKPIFRRLTQRDGLPQNSVDALLQDTDGNVWASTDGGLARIDPDTLAIRAFRAEQGVGIDGFFTGEAATTLAGELLFGGLNGLVVVHPARVPPAAEPPPIVITDVHVGSQDLTPSLSLFRPGLQIGSRDRSLTVEFAAPDFGDPDSRRYSYRLDGFDSDWQETPASRRLASYTNLPAGDFTLHLRSAGPDGKWATPLDLPVHVQPAWYEYNSMRALAAILVMWLVVGLVQMRTVLLRRRQTELERTVAERTAQLRRSQEFLERMAYFDALTGLPNRRMFNDHLRRLIAGRERGHGAFALLLIDLDGFKSINDTFGHDVGDGVLAEVAARLRTLIRETDLAARLGGDEFGVVLAQPRDAASIDSACARIIKRLREPISLANHFLVIGASIGIAGFPGDDDSPDDLYKAADTALYEAKNAGRNTWRWDKGSAETVAAASS